jgi:hypothetical protein
LRAKKVEKLHNSSYSFKTNDGLPEILKMKYRNRIQERLFPVLPIVEKKEKKINAARLTLDFLDM